MNALQLTAVVCLVLVALVAVVLAGAWIYDRTLHHESLISRELKQAILINTAQILLCCLFGLSIAWIYYAGWCATWRP